MEATISEPNVARVQSSDEPSKLQSQGAGLLLARFSATNPYLSLKHKYGNAPDVSGRRR
ncbi:MAG: hypothetical protein JWN63_3628 [Candidatus Acidoferrum typicum]|nr:hypothetical protein [Candidatus Acidoferrum typicum]